MYQSEYKKCNCYSKYNIVLFITLNLIYQNKGKDKKINEHNSDIHSSEPYRVTTIFEILKVSCHTLG